MVTAVPIWSRYQYYLYLWTLGAGLFLAVLAGANLRFALRLRRARRPFSARVGGTPIYTAGCVATPCLFGLFRPAIYLPPQVARDGAALGHVLAHELTHRRHRDHIWSALRCAALALHWYDPLVWLAVALSKRDGELACDEGAVARLGEGERLPYGRTLVGLVAGRSFGPGHLLQCSTTMSSGKKALRRRIEQLARRTETRRAALFAALSLLALVAVFTFSGQQGAGSDSSPDYAGFLTQVEQAQSLSLSPPLTSSTALPGPLTDPALLQEARALLESAHDFLGAEVARDWEGESLATYRLTLAGDGWEATYRLLPPAGATTDPWTYVLAQDPSGRVTEPPIAALPLHPDRLAVLLRQQEHS